MVMPVLVRFWEGAVSLLILLVKGAVVQPDYRPSFYE
jgi:hypothetical protein